MKRIILPFVALCISVAAFAYDSSTEGVQYDGNDWKIKVVGLANGKVAVTNVKLDAEATSVTIPATFHAQWDHSTDVACDYNFEVAQAGNGEWAIYVERESASFLASVTSLTISEGVTTIAANAFSGAASLTSIYFNGTTAPSVAADAFQSDILTSCPAYVTTWEAKDAIDDVFTTVKYHTIDLWENWYGEYDWHNTHLVDLTLHRTFLAANGWYTLCVPASFDNWNLTNAFGDDVQLMELTSSAMSGDELQLTFTEATAVTAGKPYLVKVTADVTNPTFLGVSFDNTASTTVSTTYASMVGSFSTMELDNTKYYLGPNNYLYPPETTVSMDGYRAYFTLSPNVQAHAPARIVFHDQTTTDIVSPSPSSEGKGKAYKVLRDGQVFIIRNRVEYNALGQMVK